MNGGIKDLNEVTWAEISPLVARLREAEANHRAALRDHVDCKNKEINARRDVGDAEEEFRLARTALFDALYEKKAVTL